jgi:hypothetical protein
MAALKKTAPAAKPAAAVKAPAKPITKIGGTAKTTASKPVKEKPAPAALPPLVVGNIATFKGYTTERAPGDIVFAKDEATGKMPRIAICEINEGAEGVGNVYTVTAVEDYHQFVKERAEGVEDDALSMKADMLTEGEIKRGVYDKDKGSYPVVPDAPAPIEVLSIGTMDEMLAKYEGDSLRMAQSLFDDSEKSLFYVGGALARLKLLKEYTGFADPSVPGGETPYTSDGKGWEKFVTDNFPPNFGLRKAEGYVSLYTKISALPEPNKIVDRLNEIGYAKAQLIAGHITAENVEEIVNDAASQTVVELKNTVATKYVTESGTNAQGKAATRQTIKVLKMEFKFHEDTAVGLNFLFEEAKKSLGLDANGTFETILQQWAMDHLSGDIVSKAESRRAQKLAALEKSGAKLPKDHPVAVARAKADASVLHTPAVAAAPAAGAVKPALKPASAAKAAVAGLAKGGAKLKAAA